jgi:hypothetical protein
MSIQRQRKQSLTRGRFITLEQVHYDFLENIYLAHYKYISTQGRLTIEKPLLSVGRWLKSPTEVLRKLCIKNKRVFV